MLWCGVNRRLRCWERTTVTASRRTAGFRVQGGREMKQVMRPAQRGATAPVGAGAWWRFPAGEPIGGHCARRGRGHGGRRDADRGTPSRWGLGWVAWIPVQPQATHRCVNRRLRRWERATATALRRGAAFRAQDGWRRQGWGCWKGQGCCIEAYSWGYQKQRNLLSEPSRQQL